MTEHEPTIRCGAIPVQRKADLLIVEDYKDVADMLAMCLEANGYSVQIARSVDSALKACDGCTFSLVLSDWSLPDGTGVDLIRRLRRRGGVRAIALSGYDSRQHQTVSRQAGFSEYLVKPIEEKQLLAAIERVLGR